jgi:hypothetical protein
MIQERLYARVKRFMEDNGVTCEESIHQCDRVIENAYEFIEDLFRIIQPDLPKEDDDDYETIVCKMCFERKSVEKGTWALDKGMCEPCYAKYQ